ncbi:rRNA maturation RNase YbeY [Saccharicrinis fermentans]|uniref:rRNA maturation RNase YbeY n=1 Tax=Saccharicrinis fermentans TaxID=982 RepID=UPI000486EC4F|nr:rRNA maturation RNase YbeY [Saccharicrinis fermentans]
MSDIQLDTDLLKRWINIIVDQHKGICKEISFLFCSDEYILKINRDYLNHDYYTDVITFDYCEDNFISGDILISLDTVRSNAKEYNTVFKDELHRVIIHGILHLLGFKDKTDQEDAAMHALEDQALEVLKTIS